MESPHLPVLIFPNVNYPEMGCVYSVQSSLAKEEGGFEGLQRQWERAVLLATLQRNGGNKTNSAKELKMSVRNLYYKLERHALI